MHRSTKAPAVRRHHHATLGAHWNSACVLCPSLHGHGPRLARNVPPAGWSSRERVRVVNVSIRATRAGHRGSPWEMGILDGLHASHCPAVVSADARMPAARARVDLAGAVRVAVCGCRRFRECPSLASVWAVRHRRRAGCGRQSAPPTLAGERRPDLRVWRAARQRARGSLRSVSHVSGVWASPRHPWTDAVAGLAG